MRAVSGRRAGTRARRATRRTSPATSRSRTARCCSARWPRARSRVTNCAPGATSRSTMGCVAALGATVERSGPGAFAFAAARGTIRAAALDCGNSGTTMRLLMGALAGRGVEATLDGDDSLRRRPMRRVADPLARARRGDRDAPTGRPRSTCTAATRCTAADRDLAIASAQLATSLTIGGDRSAPAKVAHLRRGSARDHTAKHAAALRRSRVERAVSVLVVDGPAALPRADFRVPGDPSAAAFWLAAAAIVPGARIAVATCASTRRASASSTRSSAWAPRSDRRSSPRMPEPIGHDRGRARGRCTRSRSRAAEVPAIIDELPLLGIVAAYAPARRRVRGAARAAREGERPHRRAGRTDCARSAATVNDGRRRLRRHRRARLARRNA